MSLHGSFISWFSKRLSAVRANGAAFLLAMGLVSGWAFAADAPPGFPAQGRLQIQTQAVLLNPSDPTQTRVGEFVYRGGLQLSSAQTDQLHGFSDLDLLEGHRLIAVGDRGALLEAVLILDQQQALKGLESAVLKPLTGEDGQFLLEKADSDAEGLTHLRNGDRLVSFEEKHRILRYPAVGGPPRVVPFPRFVFEPNQAMEALTADLEKQDVYWVGSEFTGDVWRCHLNQTKHRSSNWPDCQKHHSVALPPDLFLVAMRQLPQNRTAYLLRAYFPERKSNKILLRIVENKPHAHILAELELAPPLIQDNFEGLAAEPMPQGGTRFYLLSDDNFNPEQRTLLLAFDWEPKGL
ncbi:MAG: esterase-like activity of phytase family protein [Candidatus Sericytochromatia bacterium]